VLPYLKRSLLVTLILAMAGCGEVIRWPTGSTCAPPGSRYGDNPEVWVCPEPQGKPLSNAPLSASSQQKIWGRDDYNTGICSYSLNESYNRNDFVALADEQAAPVGSRLLALVFLGKTLNPGPQGTWATLYSTFEQPQVWYNYLPAGQPFGEFPILENNDRVPIFIWFSYLKKDGNREILLEGNYVYTLWVPSPDGGEVLKFWHSCSVGQADQVHPQLRPDFPNIPKKITPSAP
jgi:hypothetical protein